MKKQNIFLPAMMMAVMGMASCSDDNANDKSWNIGDATEIDYPEDYFTGGQLGTTTNNSSTAYKQPSLAVENAGMATAFNEGEYFFEKDFNTNSSGPFKGLGPVYVRPGCLYCHPGYGHGARQNSYSAKMHRNGYLLVIYDKKTNAYIRSVAGMPQTAAVAPFKAPIDESQIRIKWNHYTDEWGNKFDDGESYDLTYPEVTIPASAYYAPVYVQRDGKDVEITASEYNDNIDIRLESTIGIYGTGLLDAIDPDEMKQVYQEQAAQGAKLNPAIWDTDANDWAASAWYTLADGQKKIKKFTYAMTRASLQDGAGANAIWNITNVTRSDRHYLYTTKAWAKAMSQDEEVINYILANGNDKSSVLYPYWASTREEVAQKVNTLLGLNSNNDKQTFEQYFLQGAPYNGEEEMSTKDYYDFMVWHRGLAVPAARNLDRAEVKRGKQLFMQMGCASCHKPSWTTGDDNYWVDNCIKEYAAANGKDAQSVLPRYPKQKIWPYTDMVQHRLFMANDIRTGWCRTTPLWGRGLSMRLTGASDRLHDCRARTVTEAIMWHAYSKESDAYWSAEQFYYLNKEDRDAVVAFIEAI